MLKCSGAMNNNKNKLNSEIIFIFQSNPNAREIIESSGGPHHLSTIPLKNFHLFKITELVINFYF